MLGTAVRTDRIVNGQISVHPITSSHVELRIAGELPAVWPERFATVLASKSITILRGEAECRAGYWTGVFELDSNQLDSNLCEIDYAAVLQSLPSVRQPRPIVLLRYGLVRLANVLRLAIQTEHSQGLLADLLARLKYLGLYPKRVTIDCASGSVTQCFWLTGYGNREPDLQTERMLREFLTSCRKSRRS